jgi:hypothetical protein
MFRILIIAFLLSISINLYSQKQSAIWYFGDHAGLDFNNGPPTPITSGQTYLQNGHAEGTSVISDSSGALLFYSNGEKVWNQNHQVMPNGDSIYGSYSSTQSCIILPLPASDNLFYLFTLDDFNHNMQFGFRYSVIDMCMDNNNGDIIPAQKNILLLDTAGEKLTAIRHANGADYWIIVHEYFSDAFYSYLLTSTGITDTLITHIGSTHTTSSSSLAGAIGYMKASPNGNKIALVSDNGSRLRELFDFDKNTGSVSNYVDLHIPADSSHGAYGVSFSPNSSKLYITYNIQTWQYDLDAGGGNPSAIRNSKLSVNGPSPHNDYGLQLAPDGKIYISQCGDTILNVINNPDVAGIACNYSYAGVTLNGKFCNFGLPNMVDSYSYSNTISQCETGITTLPDEISLNIYPNPFSLYATIEFENPRNEIHHLEVYNIYGQLIVTTNNFNENTIILDKQNFTNGVYFFRLCKDQEVITTRKLMVQ